MKMSTKKVAQFEEGVDNPEEKGLQGSQSDESIDLNDPDFLQFLLFRELQVFEEKLKNYSKKSPRGSPNSKCSPNSKVKKVRFPAVQKIKKAHPFLSQQARYRQSSAHSLGPSAAATSSSATDGMVPKRAAGVARVGTRVRSSIELSCNNKNQDNSAGYSDIDMKSLNELKSGVQSYPEGSPFVNIDISLKPVPPQVRPPDRSLQQSLSASRHRVLKFAKGSINNDTVKAGLSSNGNNVKSKENKLKNNSQPSKISEVVALVGKMRNQLEKRANLVPPIAPTSHHKLNLSWRLILEKIIKIQATNIALVPTLYIEEDDEKNRSLVFYFTEDKCLRRETVINSHSVLELWTDAFEKTDPPATLIFSERNSIQRYSVGSFKDFATRVETAENFNKDINFVHLLSSFDIYVLVATFHKRSNEMEVVVDTVDIEPPHLNIGSVDEFYVAIANVGSKLFSLMKSLFGKSPCKLTATFAFDSVDQGSMQLCSIHDLYI